MRGYYAELFISTVYDFLAAYAPAPNFMLKKLRTLPMFHDPDYPLPLRECDDDDDDAVPFVMP